MQPLNALVKNGRLTLDTPTELPDGEVVVLIPLDDLRAAFEDAGPDPVVFQVDMGRPSRSWKKEPRVNAESMIAELRAM